MKSNKKMKNISRSKNKGFTLVELLAVISLLSLLFSIVISVVYGVISEIKNNGYKTTINNVQSAAVAYSSEYVSSNIWIDGSENLQYQCISVNKLIDSGYFKSDILNSNVSADRKILEDDYVYLERNHDTKSITKSVLLLDSTLDYLCDSVSSGAVITCSAEPSGWSKKKDVTIKYNLYNFDNVNNYSYVYSYGDITSDNSFLHRSENVELQNVVENSIKGYVYDKDGNLISDKVCNFKIDNVKPKSRIYYSNNVSDEQELEVILIDSESGLSNYYFGPTKLNDVGDNVSWSLIDDCDECNRTTLSGLKVNSSGTYYFSVKDVVGNVRTTENKFYETKLVISNASVMLDNKKTDKIISKSGYLFEVPEVILDDGYRFEGWYSTSDYSGEPLTTYTPTADGAIYGKVVRNNYNVKISYNINGGALNSSASYTVDTNGDISYNGEKHLTKIEYGSVLDGTGLYNYNNSSYINVLRDGYIGVKNAEWTCLSGNCNKQTYAQDLDTYTSDDFCDASSSDCEITLGVNWEIRTYLIKLDHNDGTGVIDEYTKTHNKSIKLTRPTRNDGYRLIEYNTKADGSGTTYRSTARSFTENKDITLYAIWDRTYVKIRYYLNGGSFVGSDAYSLSGGYVSKDGDTYLTKIEYGATIESSGLYNYNNPYHINVRKADYKVVLGEEWICTSSDCQGKIYNQDVKTYKSDDFCNASSSDCVVDLSINWKSSPLVLSINNTYLNKWYSLADRNAGKKYKITLTASGSVYSIKSYSSYYYNSNGEYKTISYDSCNGNNSCSVTWSDELYDRDVTFRVCDVAGACEWQTTKIKYDITPPVITCKNSPVPSMTEVFNDGITPKSNEINLTPENNNNCIVSGKLTQRDASLEADYYGIREANDNFVTPIVVGSWLEIINENGKKVDNLMRTYPHCNCDTGYCQMKYYWSVKDEAGNVSESVIIYKLTYNSTPVYGCK